MPPEDHTIHVQQLFVRHQNAVMAFVLSLLPRFSEAEDVLQETFLTVTRKAADFQDDSNFTAWACTIARLKVLEAQRRSGRPAFSTELVDALAASVPSGLFDERRLQALSDCLSRLPPQMRELMQLRYYGEKLPEEIARCLSRSPRSINVALGKARVMLRDCIRRTLRREEAV